MLTLTYHTRDQRESTVHSPDGWYQKRAFDNPDDAFSALLRRWRAGDLSAEVLVGDHLSGITLGIQYDYKGIIQSAEFRKIAKELYDERIPYLVEG